MNPIHQRIHRYGQPVALAVLAALSGAAHAADTATSTESPALQEVVVTATKRVTNEQTTPQAITAFSASQLSATHVNDLSGLAMYTPGLFVGADNGFGATAIAIRGFGPLNDSIGADEAVGVYIDGVYQGTPYGNLFNFIDVADIEVLRGPQGTLYGRNATGGAIVINTITPGPTTVVRADISAGELNSYEGRALVSGPIGDGFYGKIAIGRSSQDGWATNPVLGTKLNGQDDFNTAAGLRWYKGGVWDFMLNVHYGTQDSTLAAKNANDGLPIDIVPAQFPNEGYRTFSGETLNSTATLPWAVFTSITGYTDAQNHYLTSSGTVGLTQYLEVSRSSEWYEEMRLASPATDRFTWLVGGTALREHASDTLNYLLTAADLDSTSNLGIVFGNGLVTTSYSGFLELGYRLTDRLHVTLGDRYTSDRKVWSNCVTYGQYSDLTIVSNSPVLCDIPSNSETKKWTASTPKAVIDYRITDDLFSYVSYNRGFRDGGWNFTSAVNPAQPYSTAFNPEYASSYEVGLKSEFLDHRVRANLAAYLANYSNLQVRTIDPVYHLLGIHNAGAARTKGVELEIKSRPTDRLTLGGNLAWERALYTSFSYVSAGTLLNYAGNYLNDAPEWLLNLNAAYAIPLNGRGTLTPRVDASYQSVTYFTGANVSPYDSPGHEALNLDLRYDAESSPWGCDLYVLNATGKQWAQYAYQGVGSVVGVNYAAPRIVGVRLFWNE